MTQVMIGLRISELTPNGFVSIIEVESDEEIEDKEIQEEAISKMTQTLYESDKFFMVVEDAGVVIRGIKNKTLKVEPMWKVSSAKPGSQKWA